MTPRAKSGGAKATRARVCYGCKLPGSVWAIEGGYWHIKCAKGASAEQKMMARHHAYNRRNL